MCGNLHELNPEDTIGEAIQQSPSEFMEGADFSAFSLVIACEVTNEIATKLAAKCKSVKEQVPLVICRQYGLVGSLRIVVDQVCVAEQKPMQVKTTDLRVNDPFPELLDYVNKIDMTKQPLHEHSHTPWVVVLLKAADAWKE